jgi:hypothetical protein
MKQLRYVVVIGAGVAAAAALLHAQHAQHPPRGHGEHPAGEHAPAAPAQHAHVGSELSAKAREQIRQVEASVAHLATPEAARQAGFRPVLGWIPTMGVHWINQRRMAAGFHLLEPDHLMFSPIDGRETLVGVAYAFYDRPGAPVPDAFDGDLDRWHDHPEFAPRGQTLHMLHLWFVPSPDGPFAGHNPWLPFHAAGLQPPDAARLHDDADAERIRKLALALAEAVTPMQFGQSMERFVEPALLRRIEARRAAIRESVPQLDAATRADDLPAWNRAADRAVAEWEAIRDAYLAAIPLPHLRQRLVDLYAEMTGGGHGHHHQHGG